MANEPQVRVTQASSGRLQLRCCLCHDALDADPAGACPACGVHWHVDCQAALGRCPTLGCATSALRAPDLPRRALWRWLGDLELSAGAGALAFGLVFVIALLQGDERSRPHQDVTGLIFGLGLFASLSGIGGWYGWRRLNDRLRAWRLERDGQLTQASVERWELKPGNSFARVHYRYRDPQGASRTGVSGWQLTGALRPHMHSPTLWVWVDPADPARSRWSLDP